MRKNRDFYDDDVDNWDDGALRYENRRDWMAYKRHVAGKREYIGAWGWFMIFLACGIVSITIIPLAIIPAVAAGAMCIIKAITSKIKGWYWRN